MEGNEVKPTGWFGNHRTLEEQMLGLKPALAEASGKRVLDVGCAEGLIAAEFVRAGATVDAFDNNKDFAGKAGLLAAKTTGMRARYGVLDAGLPKWLRPRYDIVLALAVLHKALDVPAAALVLARATESLMVVRLQFGSTGLVTSKHTGSTCDLHTLFPEQGLKLKRTEEGPRGELVQYWRR